LGGPETPSTGLIVDSEQGEQVGPRLVADLSCAEVLDKICGVDACIAVAHELKVHDADRTG
jgi:hypothetical protein